VKERLYDNPLVVMSILTFVLVGADERIKRLETVEKRRSKVATEICSKAHFKINEPKDSLKRTRFKVEEVSEHYLCQNINNEYCENSEMAYYK
jgi:hypothetical protein